MKRRILLHSLFWIMYILFETYLEYSWISVKYTQLSLWQHLKMAFLGEAAIGLVKIPLSYFILFLLDLFAKRVYPFLLLTILTIAGFSAAIGLYRVIAFYYVLPGAYMGLYENQPLFGLEQNMNAFLDLLFCVMLAVATKQYRLAQRSRENAERLERERLQAELKFLRAQINPHFLFNTLNNIYALARKKSEDTAEVVMRLSKLLRFMLYESGSGRIKLEEELKVMEDYISLERIRYGDRLLFSFDKEIGNGKVLIVPLILLPFVDNAFKHGASESWFQSWIRMSLTESDGWLHLVVKNSFENAHADEINKGIGLSNIKRQLELVYPEHTLEVRKEQGQFIADLRLNLLAYATV